MPLAVWATSSSLAATAEMLLVTWLRPACQLLRCCIHTLTQNHIPVEVNPERKYPDGPPAPPGER